jgi:release factor glutamine methyltransferase
MKNKDIQKETEWLLKEKYGGHPAKIKHGVKKFNADVKRLKKGEPVDYVIGFINFLGCKIDLSKKPLIPRKETEHWAAYAARDIKDRVDNSNDTLRVLDIFSGSGCVGIAIMAHLPNVLCDFADKNKNAISQIKINLKNNFIKKPKSKIIQSDIFSKVKSKYDYILANPPYIPIKNKNKVQKSVLKYEPKDALFAGEDGMKYINKFLKNAKKYLKPYGRIYMEFDPPQKEGIESLIRKYGYTKWWFIKDQFGCWRLVVIE